MATRQCWQMGGLVGWGSVTCPVGFCRPARGQLGPWCYATWHRYWTWRNLRWESLTFRSQETESRACNIWHARGKQRVTKPNIIYSCSRILIWHGTLKVLRRLFLEFPFSTLTYCNYNCNTLTITLITFHIALIAVIMPLILFRRSICKDTPLDDL
jgi:hypothetical protein